MWSRPYSSVVRILRSISAACRLQSRRRSGALGLVMMRRCGFVCLGWVRDFGDSLGVLRHVPEDDERPQLAYAVVSPPHSGQNQEQGRARRCSGRSGVALVSEKTMGNIQFCAKWMRQPSKPH